MSYINEAIYSLEEKFPQYSLRLWLQQRKNLKTYLACAFAITVAIVAYPQDTCLGLFFILNILYSAVQLFKLILLIIGGSCAHYKEHLKEPDDLPIYSILIPLYNEDKVLKKLIKAIEKIDYPKHLLDVKLLIEEDDIKTLHALERLVIPEFFTVIKIPTARPRTKPKACNYGLKFAKGNI